MLVCFCSACLCICVNKLLDLDTSLWFFTDTKHSDTISRLLFQYLIRRFIGNSHNLAAYQIYIYIYIYILLKGQWLRGRPARRDDTSKNNPDYNMIPVTISILLITSNLKFESGANPCCVVMSPRNREGKYYNRSTPFS